MSGSHVRKAFASKGDDTTLSRWVKTRAKVDPAQGQLLASPRVIDPKLLRRPAVVAGRSIFHAKGVRPSLSARPASPMLNSTSTPTASP